MHSSERGISRMYNQGRASSLLNDTSHERVVVTSHANWCTIATCFEERELHCILISSST